MLTEDLPVAAGPLAVVSLGAPLGDVPLHFIWAHGWGHDHRAFLPLASAFERQGSQSLIEFPGFGQAPPPPTAWTTADYADATAAWLAGLPRMLRIWIGHSFGCRVGLQLAARHPDAVDAMFLIAAAGLQRARSPVEQVSLKARIAAYKSLKLLDRLGVDTAAMRSRFGSADYRSAGPMRGVLVNAVREDLSDVARQVRCPVELVYGENDTETPPEMGERFARFIPGATLTILPRFDHITILTTGLHQVQNQLATFAARVQS
jgi:pimeloyl-ACP methyl ester carboxylesterase